ncbi:hypothetical protein O9G_003590 [Rozella allomycis CSF55]|uniref:Uncharacterized protein n=1 Tax=Rozella allomycis (strain CSF55) TaxID=988480 RepID=A0A075APA3_ROZAC|nr:hypothetical protein O9G_003590 [Rozella allomycis CSF55]|eukprot:EPZ31881.1 hypothetical protein O9G_003590 [Rozella allomycis CSF55]
MDELIHKLEYETSLYGQAGCSVDDALSRVGITDEPFKIYMCEQVLPFCASISFDCNLQWLKADESVIRATFQFDSLGLNAIQQNIVEAVARAGSQGMSQLDILKQFEIDPRSSGYYINGIVEAKLFVKYNVVREGRNTSLYVWKDYVDEELTNIDFVPDRDLWDVIINTLKSAKDQAMYRRDLFKLTKKPSELKGLLRIMEKHKYIELFYVEVPNHKTPCLVVKLLNSEIKPIECNATSEDHTGSLSTGKQSLFLKMPLETQIFLTFLKSGDAGMTMSELNEKLQVNPKWLQRKVPNMKGLKKIQEMNGKVKQFRFFADKSYLKNTLEMTKVADDNEYRFHVESEPVENVVMTPPESRTMSPIQVAKRDIFEVRKEAILMYLKEKIVFVREKQTISDISGLFTNEYKMDKRTFIRCLEKMQEENLLKFETVTFQNILGTTLTKTFVFLPELTFESNEVQELLNEIKNTIISSSINKNLEIRDMQVEKVVLDKPKKSTLDDETREMYRRNGFVFPKFPKAKILHNFLFDNFKDEKFDLQDIINKFTLMNYCQLVGTTFEMLPEEREVLLFPEFEEIVDRQRMVRGLLNSLDILKALGVIKSVGGVKFEMNFRVNGVNLKREEIIRVFDVKDSVSVLMYWVDLESRSMQIMCELRNEDEGREVAMKPLNYLPKELQYIHYHRNWHAEVIPLKVKEICLNAKEKEEKIDLKEICEKIGYANFVGGMILKKNKNKKPKVVIRREEKKIESIKKKVRGKRYEWSEEEDEMILNYLAILKVKKIEDFEDEAISVFTMKPFEVVRKRSLKLLDREIEKKTLESLISEFELFPKEFINKPLKEIIELLMNENFMSELKIELLKTRKDFNFLTDEFIVLNGIEKGFIFASKEINFDFDLTRNKICSFILMVFLIPEEIYDHEIILNNYLKEKGIINKTRKNSRKFPLYNFWLSESFLHSTLKSPKNDLFQNISTFTSNQDFSAISKNLESFQLITLISGLSCNLFDLHINLKKSSEDSYVFSDGEKLLDSIVHVEKISNYNEPIFDNQTVNLDNMDFYLNQIYSFIYQSGIHGRSLYSILEHFKHQIPEISNISIQSFYLNFIQPLFSLRKFVSQFRIDSLTPPFYMNGVFKQIHHTSFLVLISLSTIN